MMLFRCCLGFKLGLVFWVGSIILSLLILLIANLWRKRNQRGRRRFLADSEKREDFSDYFFRFLCIILCFIFINMVLLGYLDHSPMQEDILELPWILVVEIFGKGMRGVC